MKRPSEADRRTYIKGLGTAAVLAGIPVAAGAAGGDRSDHGKGDNDDGRGRGRGRRGDDEIPVAHPFIGDLDGMMLSGDGTFDVDNRYDGDPADGDRDWVVHYTTDGQETQDYPAALINLRKRLRETVTLGSFLEDRELRFDYYVGPDHDQYIPGQVYLVIQTQRQRRNNMAWGLYKNVRKGGPRGEWATLDVVEEMSSEGTDAPWRAVEIEIDPEGFRGDDTLSDAILEQAIATRDEEGERFQDVFGRFRNSARLLAAGLGSGSSRSATVRDIYYDNFHVGPPDNEDRTFELPAAIEMDATFENVGSGDDERILVTLTLPEDQEWVDLADVDEDSILGHGYTQIVPTVAEGADPSRVDVSEDDIEVEFPPDRFEDVEGVGSGQQQLIVTGRFDYEHVVWFFGVGEATV